ncbi:DUF3239 domain-containing protein [Corynebacterium uropygiale]|uniref:DUF3239 domain-containing protein n=1 Tax=Corynebacterium uropygiale TaxID=1775911 RepID=A0A9X1QS17_9CORY|nr:DUF3239 domain-containing protein [Corynebacterium uropygiale]MCF4006718.1 DUF3239 domain-containing protein [Corynebacterium uropygiale]
MSDFHFAVDRPFAKKHNELLRDTRRLQFSAYIFALILLAIGGGLAWYLRGGGMQWIVLGLFIILAIIFAVIGSVVPKKVGDPQRLYDTYPLAPAVVADVNPRDVVLLALVNTTVDPQEPPRWALCARTCSGIGLHERRTGEKVPAVAVSGSRKLGELSHWDQVTPMPIAWATQDPDIVHEARHAIPHEQWRILEKNIRKVSDVQATAHSLLPLSSGPKN